MINLTLTFRETAPVFAMGFVFDHGPIRSLKWFPKCTHKVFEPVSDSFLNRIGVLAIAFADGFIGVYTIPDPQFFSADENIIL